MKKTLLFLLILFLAVGRSLAFQIVKGRVEKVDYKSFKAVLVTDKGRRLGFSFSARTKFFYKKKARNLRWAESNFLSGSMVEVVLENGKALEIKVLFVPQ